MEYQQQGKGARGAHQVPTIFDLISEPISSFLGNVTGGEGQRAFPVDVRDAGDHYEILADLPGIPRDKVSLAVDDGVVSISCERDGAGEGEGDSGYLVRERRQGSASRSFSLQDVDEEQVQATFSDGVLRVTLGKRSGQSRRHTIEIH